LHTDSLRLDFHIDPVGSEAPTGIANVTATFTIPLTSVAVSSSAYFPVFHYMGEKPAIRLYTTDVMYSVNGCMQKQAEDSYTLTDRWKFSKVSFLFNLPFTISVELTFEIVLRMSQCAMYNNYRADF